VSPTENAVAAGRTPILDVRDLRVEFRTPVGKVRAVDGMSYQLFENEIVGIVGESGCGKSASQLAVMQLLQSPPGYIAGGEVIFEGNDLLKYKRNGPEMRSVRGGQIAMIFQEPMNSLNPVMTIGAQLVEAYELHCGLKGETGMDHAVELLKMVGIPAAERRVRDYPHQFSGGMCQRVMIAMGLSCSPRILIADEPTTALDVTTQAQMLELMKRLIRQVGASLVIVTHNLGVVARYVERIYVMYAGRVVEEGTTKDIFGRPSHPYTRGLLGSVPRLDEEQGHRLVSIEGMPPNLVDMPGTCAFLPRCPFAVEQCRRDPWPDLRSVGDGHRIRCYVDLKEWGDGPTVS
jgi:oligopeptide/dipeptide ABC transporter ATP-binding protein